jgi:hypothetical protein
MKVRKRHYAFTAAGLALFVGLSWWIKHVPEPKYQGVGLGDYLRRPRTFPPPERMQARRDAREAVKALGASAVPYLANQIEKDPLREFLFKIAPKMPAKVASMFPDRFAYSHRRSTAAAFLPEAGTNAVSAVPRLIELAEAESPNYTHNFIRAIGMLAPGTEHEDPARRLILRVIREARTEPDNELRRMSYHFLGTLGGDEVLPALIDGLKEPQMVDRCIESLVRLGTNAIPHSKKAAEAETGHIRPATLALEKVQAGR